jgi:germacradienol/geosmin synthase
MQPFELPEFYIPYPARLNPNLEEARVHSNDYRKFDVADVALCSASIYPNASGPELNVTACWLVWVTYTDDYFPALYGYLLSGAVRLGV